MRLKTLSLALALGGLLALPAAETAARRSADDADPLLLNPGVCSSGQGQPPAPLRQFILAQARSETRPFDPSLTPRPAADPGTPPLWTDLGSLSMPITTASRAAQRYFDQGLRFAFAFNHGEARRAFLAAQRLDPGCAMCYWGEALVLGPNINAPMFPEAIAPALAASRQAQALADGATAREQALIAALAKRYTDDAKAERAPFDAAYGDAMAEVARRFPADDTIQTLYAEALMDMQPWDYWEAGGTRPKGRVGDLIPTLERVLQRNQNHPGAIHLYIHAVEASANPKRALPHARRLAALMPGAGHLVHMPAHIYYRVGLYRESLATNVEAVAADERHFARTPPDPFYRAAYYPHNVHFLMASAQMGGDGKTALAAAAKLDRIIAPDLVKSAGILQPVKAAPYFAHAQFSSPDTILALPDPGPDFVLVQALWHYARAVAFAGKRDGASAEREIAALQDIEGQGDFQPLNEWQVPGQAIVQTARHVASGRLAAARGDLPGAIKAYEQAVAIEDSLSYMEPPYWYYPVRQSLGAVLLRAGRVDAAEQAFRTSLAKTPNNGWALFGLEQVFRQRGDAKAAAAARQALQRAWFGEPSQLDLARL